MRSANDSDWTIEMTVSTRRPLEDYLAFAYPFQVVADKEGGFLVCFPDLPGCFTQVDDVDDIGPMAEEIRTLWIETEYERGADIPLPTYPEEYSGKFNLRLPRSLHRHLAEAAEADGVSLNQYVVMLLTRGVTVATLSRTHPRLSNASDRGVNSESNQCDGASTGTVGAGVA
jgi:antitoxin HicB